MIRHGLKYAPPSLPANGMAMYDVTKVRVYEIHFKGYFPSIEVDTILHKHYADVRFKNGIIVFKGNEEQYNAFYKETIPHDESMMKVIGERSFTLEDYDMSLVFYETKNNVKKQTDHYCEYKYFDGRAYGVITTGWRCHICGKKKDNI